MEKKNIIEEVSEIFCGATGCALPENLNTLPAETVSAVSDTDGESKSCSGKTESDK